MNADSEILEKDLILQAQEGDVEAFGRLVEKYKERVYMLAFQLTHNHSDADEISQVSFVKAFKSLKQFKNQSSFFTWLYRITSNTFIDNIRKIKNRTREYEENFSEHQGSPQTSKTEQPGKTIEKEEKQKWVWKILNQLGEELKATVVLVYLQELKPKEAAVVLGCAEATVHWRLFRARKQLKRLFKDSPEG